MAHTNNDNLEIYVKEQKVIWGFDVETLNRRISESIKEGYVPVNVPFVFSQRLCQTMVKYDPFVKNAAERMKMLVAQEFDIPTE